jgi:hypothetical protein
VLTRADLEAIRRIVREELDRALGRRERNADQPPRAAASDDEPSDEHAADMREMVAADLAALRGEPGAKQRERVARARYRLRWDELWCARAKRTLSMPEDARLSVEDMLRAMRLWDAANARVQAKAKATRERNKQRKLEAQKRSDTSED